MCSPRLSYVYLSSFPICAVSVYPCARIPFAYDHHHHHHLFYLIFQLEEKQKAYIRSALFYPFVNTPMCIVLVVPLPSMAALASFSDPASVPSSLFCSDPFVCQCHVFNFRSAPCYIVYRTPTFRDDIFGRVCNEVNEVPQEVPPSLVVRLMVKPHYYSLSNLLPHLSPFPPRRADMAIVQPTPRSFPVPGKRCHLALILGNFYCPVFRPPFLFGFKVLSSCVVVGPRCTHAAVPVCVCSI